MKFKGTIGICEIEDKDIQFLVNVHLENLEKKFWTNEIELEICVGENLIKFNKKIFSWNVGWCKFLVSEHNKKHISKFCEELK